MERRPSIDPPLMSVSFFSASLSSPLFDLSLLVVANSLVGEVKLAAKPVDLLVVKIKMFVKSQQTVSHVTQCGKTTNFLSSEKRFREFNSF